MSIKLTEDQFRQMDADSQGICVSCGFEQDGCEPDARNYECYDCGEDAVFGVSELLISGEIEIVEDEDEQAS